MLKRLSALLVAFVLASTGALAQALPTFYGSGTYQMPGELQGMVPQVRGGPALSLAFSTYSTGIDLSSRGVTFTRAGGAMEYDSTGKLTWAPNNLALQSQDLDNAAWAKSGVTVTPNAIAAPDGTLTADRIVATAASSQHFIYNSYTMTGSRYASVYLKKGTGPSAPDIVQVTAITDAAFLLNVNLTTGAITSTGGTVTNSSVTDAGNGWWRVSMKGSTTSNALVVSLTDNNPSFGYAGSFVGTTDIDVYAWGAQVEAVTYQTTPRPYVATTSAAYYGPRFDYDPVTLAAKGLLIEEARTNLLKDSGNLTTANWSNVGSVTAASSAVLAPDGISTMTMLTFGATAGQNTRYQQVATAVTVGQKVTISVWLSSGTASQVAIGVQGVGSPSNNISSALLTLTPTPQRFTFTATVAANDTGLYAMVGGAIGSGLVPLLPATGTIYAWGFQYEATADFATSYVPTTSASVTRAAETASMTGTAFSSWFNASEGTFIADATTLQATGNPGIFDVRATINDRLVVCASPTFTAFNVTLSAAVSQFDLGSASTYKIASAYKLNDFAGALNGGTVATDTSGAVPSGINQMLIGFQGTAASLNGWIKSLTYYRTRLPNSQLQARTTLATLDLPDNDNAPAWLRLPRYAANDNRLRFKLAGGF